MNALLLFSVLSATIVYSAMNTKLQIQGEAVLRSKNDIRVTGLEKMEYTNGAYDTYNSKYSKDTVSMFVTLPANSSITYEFKITNKSDIDYIVSQVKQISHNNNVTYTNSLKVNDDVIDYAASNSAGTEKTFTIKITNNTATTQVETLSLQFVFEEATYKASQLSYSNVATSCKNAQCAIDELAKLAK